MPATASAAFPYPAGSTGGPASSAKNATSERPRATSVSTRTCEGARAAMMG